MTKLGRPGAPVDHQNGMVSAPGASEQDSWGATPGNPPRRQRGTLGAGRQQTAECCSPRTHAAGPPLRGAGRVVPGPRNRADERAGATGTARPPGRNCGSSSPAVETPLN